MMGHRNTVASATAITDAELSYKFPKGVVAAIGANNLFDQHPDKIGIVNADTGMNQFGTFSPFGVTGGYWYGRVTQRF